MGVLSPLHARAAAKRAGRQRPRRGQTKLTSTSLTRAPTRPLASRRAGRLHRAAHKVAQMIYGICIVSRSARWLVGGSLTTSISQHQHPESAAGISRRGPTRASWLAGWPRAHSSCSSGARVIRYKLSITPGARAKQIRNSPVINHNPAGLPNILSGAPPAPHF